jgi:hypothetical protein
MTRVVGVRSLAGSRIDQMLAATHWAIQWNTNRIGSDYRLSDKAVNF